MGLIKEYAFCGLVLALAYGLEDMFWEHGLHGTKINIPFVVAVIICIIIIGCSFLAQETDYDNPELLEEENVHGTD